MEVVILLLLHQILHKENSLFMMAALVLPLSLGDAAHDGAPIPADGGPPARGAATAWAADGGDA